MLKAEQGKVIQDSNMFVLNKIRALEIDFYSSWYMAFGNQALVIAGKSMKHIELTSSFLMFLC